MKSTATRLTLVLIAGLLTQAPALAAKEKAKEASGATGATVATVNGVAIPQARVDLLVAQQTAQGAQDSPQLRDQIKGFLIQNELISQAAKAKGLDRNPAVTTQLDMAKQAILGRAYIQGIIQASPVSEAEVKAEYQRVVAARGGKEYKGRHILVEKEDEARDIVARLGKGEKFEDLAKLSKDPGSADKGGELEWAIPGAYVKEFGDALSGLNKGSYTTNPVKTQFGYHIIKLEDTRDTKNPPLEEVKAQLQQGLQQRKVEAHVADLAKKAKIQ